MTTTSEHDFVMRGWWDTQRKITSKNDNKPQQTKQTNSL